MENEQAFFSIRSLKVNEIIGHKRIGNAQSLSTHNLGKDNPRRKCKVNSTFFSFNQICKN